MLSLKAAVPGLDDELALVDSYIDQFLHADLDTDDTDNILRTVREGRGKMIRPSLLLLAGRFGPGYPVCRDLLCRLGAMVEIIHMASLVHDDIVDDSPLRRNRPTAQSRFGKDMAVYAGDFMLCRAMFHMFGQDFPEGGMLLCRAMEEMCRGEIGQFACRWDTETTMDTYLVNIRGKTVALFTAACRLGAMASGCGENLMNRLARVGEHLGHMFQLRDDLLDYLSEESREGKPVHKDFSDGIYTMPVLYALGNGGCGQRLREIARCDAGHEAYADLLCEMRRLVCASGGIEFTRGQIENHAVQAQRQLSMLPRNDSARVVQKIILWLEDNLPHTASLPLVQSV